MTSGPGDRDLLERRYCTGMCDVLAIALHRRHGLELGLAGVELIDDGDDEAYEGATHAFAYVDRRAGLIADARGVRHLSQMMAEIRADPMGMGSWTGRTWARSSSLQEVSEAFTCEELDEDAIEQALQDLTALGLETLAPAMSEAGSPSEKSAALASLSS